MPSLSPRSRFTAVSLFVILSACAAVAQARPAIRISRAIDETAVAPLKGNVHPLTKRSTDLGAADASVVLEKVTLVFQPSAVQEAKLTALLQQQQDRSSANYHKWLTPEEYGEQFGLAQEDTDKITAWLQQQGFSGIQVARSHTWVSFNGTAGQVAAAFRTRIDRYQADGNLHYANTVEPSVPAALSGVVMGIRNLNDFRPRPRNVAVRKVTPRFTSGISGAHFVAPDDFATIYSLKSLYNSGLDGSGQKIVVVGQTDIKLTDIQSFRSASGLPAKDPQVILVPGSSDPGVVSGDVDEANLDIEWSGAIAKNATIVYVNSKNVFTSMQYAIDNNLAPVISISYGDCEPNFSTTDSSTIASWARQANAQGQTIVAASGDTGAADCDYQVTVASHGLAVDLPASLPYVTGLGGTRFNEGTDTYWNSSNNDSNGSALSYIPEIAWNDTSFELANGGDLSASGGGRSTLYQKPSWQTGTGVPDDNARDVPDISLAASADHDGYLVCSQGNCVNGYRAADNSLIVMGGTSAGAPTFAGILALLNQKTASSQGNINPALYELAASTPSIFNDITSGDNKVPCTARTTDCTASGTLGYVTSTGYDLVTGLGSVNAANLLGSFSAAVANEDFEIAASGSTLTLTSGSTGTIPLTLTALNGFSSSVSLSCSVSSTLTGTICSLSPATVTPSGTAILTITTPAKSASLHGRPMHIGWGIMAFALCAGFLILPPTSDAKHRHGRATRYATGGLAIVLAAFTLASCGGGSSSKSNETTPPTTTTATTGTVTVLATSGSLSHSTQITVTVN